jgi:hypothetical protein
MKHSTKNLFTFAEIKRNRRIFHSQSGEDGVLLWALSRLPNRNGWCCEFGAWDGIHLSNTYFFVSQHGYKSVMIEAEKDRFEDLKKNYANFDSVLVNAMVGYGEDDSLDAIFSKTNIPINFDLLSVDIDGNDYFVWEAMTKYKPSIIIIEINVVDKPEVERINNPEAPFVLGVTGTSANSMSQLADKKGYAILAHVGCNMIYVRKELLHLYYSQPMTVEDVFTYEQNGNLSEEEMNRFAFWA